MQFAKILHFISANSNLFLCFWYILKVCFAAMLSATLECSAQICYHFLLRNENLACAYVPVGKKQLNHAKTIFHSLVWPSALFSPGYRHTSQQNPLDSNFLVFPPNMPAHRERDRAARERERAPSLTLLLLLPIHVSNWCKFPSNAFVISTQPCDLWREFISVSACVLQSVSRFRLTGPWLSASRARCTM